MNKALKERIAGIQHALDEVKGDLWSWEDDEDLDEVANLRADNARLREALEGFALRGIHADVMPSNSHRWDSIQHAAYLQEADATVRGIARRAINPKP